MKKEYNGNTFYFCGKEWKIKDAKAKDTDKAVLALYHIYDTNINNEDLAINAEGIEADIKHGVFEFCTLMLDGFTLEDVDNMSQRDKILIPFLPQISVMYLSNMSPSKIESYIDRAVESNGEMILDFNPKTKKS